MAQFHLKTTAKFSVFAIGAAPAGKPSSNKKEVKSNKKAAAKPADDDDDDCDLFGDDEDAAPAVSAADSMKAKVEAAKKAKKQAAKVDRSQIVLEVKPWEAETDLNELAKSIKAIVIDGLTWGEGHQLVPVAFGIKKLLVSCVIIDDKVLVDDITDPIEAMEEFVQSVDMTSMNRL